MVRLQPEFALQRKHHRALSARLARKQRPLGFKRGRESNGVVEGQLHSALVNEHSKRPNASLHEGTREPQRCTARR